MAPEWNSFFANAARVTGRLIVKNPKVPTITVGQSTVGWVTAYRSPSRSPEPGDRVSLTAGRAGSRIIASAVSGPT